LPKRKLNFSNFYDNSVSMTIQAIYK